MSHFRWESIFRYFPNISSTTTPHFLVKQTDWCYILGSPKPPIGNLVKHLLIILSIILLFSSTFISCSKSSDDGSKSTDNSTTTGLFVTVGESGTILTSSDGTTWDNRTSGTSYRLYEVTYGNGTFVTVGRSGTILTSSDNGTSWDNRTSGTT